MSEVVIKVIGNYSYHTTRCLGEGVYGKVYEGTQKQTKQKVAIKKIDLATFTNDKYLENAIFSEIYLLKRFNHPNIVKFKDVLSSKNSLYIITQFCKNGDLKQALKKKRFKEEEAFQVMKQILSGFSELVRERIVHRDLKPANILISDGIYKIGDFGFAKYVDNFGSQMLKSCVGSPIYMAPQILEKSPYTTKCDIWSIGVIFYEMIHNTPPWKAKDQNELLKGIKNISISHILRKSALSQKSIQFLKRTLAYSEQQRIAWAQLFQNYGPRSQKHNESQQKHKNTTRQKQRVISANSSSNLSTQYGSQNGKLNPHTPINSSNNSINNFVNLSSPAISPERKRNLFPPQTSQGHSNSNNRSQSAEHKKPNQIEGVIRWRQFLLLFHFYCVENFTTFYPFSTFLPAKQEGYARFLLSLSLLIKNRSTFCLSMIAIHSRTHKNAEDLYKTMKAQHESYEMIYNDIIGSLEKLSLYKILKTEMTSAVGHGQVINQERMQKMESYMMQNVISVVKGIVQAIKQKQNERRTLGARMVSFTKDNTQILQILDNLMQIMQLSIKRQKYNKTVQEIIEQSSNQNSNNGNTSTPNIKYELSMENKNNYIRQRKPSEQFKNMERDRERDKEMKQWGEIITRDSYGITVVHKYEKIMNLINADNNGGSLGNIKL